MKTTTIDVHRGLLDGVCRMVGKTRASVASGTFWHDDTDPGRWEFNVERVSVPLVRAKARDWGAEGGSGGIHLHFDCPVCGSEQINDDEPTDEPPFLWFSGCCVELVLVECPGLDALRVANDVHDSE